MKNFSTQLAGQIGENLLVAELGRRGIVATTFTGNVPDIDVLAYQGGKSIQIQVEALRKGNLSVRADQYLDMEFDGNIQVIKGKNDIDRRLIFAIIKIEDELGSDKFYICNQGFIQDTILRHHKGFLDQHNGVRPKNPSSMHCSYFEEDLSEFRDRWDLIEDAFT